ncbi:MAG: hypothetical protein O3A63_18730 [Proteobacteria bacterium]|nr:hypothetical protein [Pseudomonadota bacterium]
MSVIELGALGEFIGAFAIVVSLLYVGFQLRQNTRSVNAEMIQSQVDKTNQLAAMVIEQPLLLEAIIRARGGEELSAEQASRGRYSVTLTFASHLSRWT